MVVKAKEARKLVGDGAASVCGFLPAYRLTFEEIRLSYFRFHHPLFLPFFLSFLLFFSSFFHTKIANANVPLFQSRSSTLFGLKFILYSFVVKENDDCEQINA